MNEQFFDIQDRLGAGFGSLADRVPTILADPRAYPREAMLLAAIVGLAILMIVLLVIVIAEAATSTGKRKKLGVKRSGRWVPVFVFLGILGIVLLLVSLSPNTLVVSHQCDVCHALSAPVEAWEGDVHASVACYSCHASSGMAGSMQASVREVQRMVTDEDSRTVAAVYEERCLDCHENIGQGVVGTTVKMRHSDVLAAGYACADCHFEVGHEGLAELNGVSLDERRSVMVTCIGCHDGIEAPADCELCHDGRPSDDAELTPAGDTPAAIQCKGCHTTETDASCIECHGLELPHPQDFMSQHAGLSWNDPSLCARCHEQAEPQGGCDCHGEDNLHGSYADWFPKHGPTALQQWPGGCNCHEVNYCAQCHTTSPF